MPEQAWRDRPPDVTDQLLRVCLRAAAQAPSVHNTQPWLFRPRAGALDVLADRRRQLGVLDPDGRELHISIGAALLNLQVALRAHARASRVLLLPDPDQHDLCATVVIGLRTPASPSALALYAAIPRRHTNRRPFFPVSVPDADLTALVAAAMAEDASLLVADPVARHDVLTLVRAADRAQRSDGRYRMELAVWTAKIAGQADGVPPDAFGPRPDPATLPLRDFGLVHGGRRRGTRFESSPTIAVLYSRNDGPADWIRAGMALQRVLLTATARGLATSLLTQPIEIPALRARLTPPHEPRTAQAILRLGYARPVKGTPRRTVSSLIVGGRDSRVEMSLEPRSR